MLIRCQKCDRPISTAGEDCPHCGHDIRKARKTIWLKLAVVACFYLAVSVTGLAMLWNRAGELPRPEQILAVVRTNVEAVNHRDLVGLTALIHPESPGFQKMKNTAEVLFRSYELRCTLERAAIESITPDEARVRFSQVTEKISGPDFRNNRVSGVHLLRKHEGQWKLYDSNEIRVEYLDLKPERRVGP